MATNYGFQPAIIDRPYFYPDMLNILRRYQIVLRRPKTADIHYSGPINSWTDYMTNVIKSDKTSVPENANCGLWKLANITYIVVFPIGITQRNDRGGKIRTLFVIYGKRDDIHGLVRGLDDTEKDNLKNMWKTLYSNAAEPIILEKNSILFTPMVKLDFNYLSLNYNLANIVVILLENLEFHEIYHYLDSSEYLPAFHKRCHDINVQKEAAIDIEAYHRDSQKSFKQIYEALDSYQDDMDVGEIVVNYDVDKFYPSSYFDMLVYLDKNIVFPIHLENPGIPASIRKRIVDESSDDLTAEDYYDSDKISMEFGYDINREDGHDFDMYSFYIRQEDIDDRKIQNNSIIIFAAALKYGRLRYIPHIAYFVLMEYIYHLSHMRGPFLINPVLMKSFNYLETGTNIHNLCVKSIITAVTELDVEKRHDLLRYLKTNLPSLHSDVIHTFI